MLIPVVPVPLSSCVTSGHVIDFSVPQFPDLSDR